MDDLREKINNCKIIKEKNDILKGANLECANLEGANLRGAYLERADLRGANMERAYLERADLRGANMEGADLRGANLEGANLEGAIFCLCSRWPVSCKEKIINIGCKTKSEKEWDIFFAGNDEFETERGTFEFFEIEHNYRWFQQILKKYPKEFGVKK